MWEGFCVERGFSHWEFWVVCKVEKVPLVAHRLVFKAVKYLNLLDKKITKLLLIMPYIFKLNYWKTTWYCLGHVSYYIQKTSFPCCLSKMHPCNHKANCSQLQCHSKMQLQLIAYCNQYPTFFFQFDLWPASGSDQTTNLCMVIRCGQIIRISLDKENDHCQSLKSNSKILSCCVGCKKSANTILNG